MFRSLLVIAITLAAACQKEKPPTPGRAVQASALPKISVKPKAKLLLTFAKPDGTFETVQELSKVPKDRRGWVRVVDLKIKPSKRMDHELVYVADMRKKGKDGAYPYVVLPRATFEAAAVNRAHSGATAKPPARKEDKTEAEGKGKAVVLYSTRWCPACRAARDYLKENGIPFVEKDIEQDRQAAAELLAKARRAGISASGVPVLDINGTLIQGFDPNRLTALLGKRSK